MTKNKPSANHPWKTGPSLKVQEWAQKKSETTPVNNWKIKGGLDPWNK